MLTHAIIDALLGAAGLGDIGQHFPDTDERFKDADSLELLRTVVVFLEEQRLPDRARGRDGDDGAPEARALPRRDARDAGRGDADRPAHVNVKATTGERMGFVGRGEGVAAMAVATLDRPEELPAR